MNRRIIFLLSTIFFINIVKAQQFDLNNIKIDDVKNLLGNVLGKEEKNNTNWSGRIGDPNFNVADRMAINDVIDAYGIYWDTNNLDGFLSLFTDDALGVIYGSDGKKMTYLIKDEAQRAISEERMEFFKINKMQRRHMMSNTMLIELTDDSAHFKKYMMLLTTNNNSKTEIVSPIFYDFKLKKIDGIWKITFREINLDRPLDLELKP
jgi:hypothetical protein